MENVENTVVDSVKEVTNELSVTDNIAIYAILGTTLTVGYMIGKRAGRLAANRTISNYISAVKDGMDIANLNKEK